MQINVAVREVNCKIGYYGPGLSGKTTNLEVIHSKAPATNRGELTSIATEGDRTLFFDFLPLNLGNVSGMKTKFQLYTVPGQVFYNSTRKLVLQGVDGVVFVADSRRGKIEENIESLENLKENMAEYGLTLQTTPFVIQYNKRDLEDIHTVEELDRALNSVKAPTVEASALTGEGVFPTLKKLAGMVLENLNQRQASSAMRPRMLAKEPVAAGVREEAPAAPPAPRRVVRAAAEPPAVVKEQVATGVKPVERRAPRVAPRRESVSRRAAPPPKAQAKRPAGGNRALLYIVVTLVVLGGAAAALYYTGVLGRLLG